VKHPKFTARASQPTDNRAPHRPRTAIQIAPAVIADLSRIDSRRALLQVAWEWTAVISAAVLCELYFNPLTYLLAVVWIGARQHALGILLHEGCHKRIAKNRTLNYLITEILLAWPLFITFRGYEREHLAHHRCVGTEQDPDWSRTRYADYEFPKSLAGTCIAFAKHLFGLRALRDLHNMLFIAAWARDGSRWNLVARIAFYAGLGGMLVYFDLWLQYLMYWTVPVCTVLIFLLYFRLVAEHSGLPAGTWMMSRNVYTNWLGRLFISPNNVNYHLDHHLFPGVPFHNLPRLHAVLLEDSFYARHASNVHGYFGDVLGALTGRVARGPRKRLERIAHSRIPARWRAEQLARQRALSGQAARSLGRG
jgi:fatty acid desaturase